MEGLTAKEISELLGKPAMRVRNRLSILKIKPTGTKTVMRPTVEYTYSAEDVARVTFPGKSKK